MIFASFGGAGGGCDVMGWEGMGSEIAGEEGGLLGGFFGGRWDGWEMGWEIGRMEMDAWGDMAVCRK